jgi:hypothetical protein
MEQYTISPLSPRKRSLYYGQKNYIVLAERAEIQVEVMGRDSCSWHDLFVR